MLVDSSEIAELLDRKADEYEIRSAAAAERGEAGDVEEARAATPFAMVAIVLREVAEALKEAA